MEEAATSADKQPERSAYCQHRTRLAEAYLIAGRSDAAMSRAFEALELAKQHGGKSHEAWALWILGEINTSLSEVPDASIDRYFRKAVAIAEECSIKPLVAHCHFGRGKLYYRAKAWGTVRRELNAAIRCYRELDMGYWLKLAEVEAERMEATQLLASR